MSISDMYSVQNRKENMLETLNAMKAYAVGLVEHEDPKAVAGASFLLANLHKTAPLFEYPLYMYRPALHVLKKRAHRLLDLFSAKPKSSWVIYKSTLKLRTRNIASAYANIEVVHKDTDGSVYHIGGLEQYVEPFVGLHSKIAQLVERVAETVGVAHVQLVSEDIQSVDVIKILLGTSYRVAGVIPYIR